MLLSPNFCSDFESKCKITTACPGTDNYLPFDKKWIVDENDVWFISSKLLVNFSEAKCLIYRKFIFSVTVI